MGIASSEQQSIIQEQIIVQYKLPDLDHIESLQTTGTGVAHQLKVHIQIPDSRSN